MIIYTCNEPPPVSDAFRNAGLNPNSWAAQSITEASNSVQAGLDDHYSDQFISIFWDHKWSYIESRITCTGGVQIREDTFKRTGRWKVSKERRVLPVR